MSLTLIVLIVLLASAVAVAAWSLEAMRRRLRVLGRATAESAGFETRLTIGAPHASRWHRLLVRVTGWVPDLLLLNGSADRLTRAGFESPLAPSLYALLRLTSAIAVPLIVVKWAARDSFPLFIASVVAAIGLGLLLPRVILDVLQHYRKDHLRRSLPDALDLLLVCVEAGVSLDAAVLRVGREMGTLHPELANELLVLSRKTNAGVRREDALREMYDRTGIEELRALTSTLIQSEKWGTSIGTVLRVYAETLRRRRRQAAEKRAAIAASKMVFPLALLILPALFVVLGGPMVLGLRPVFEAMTNR